jgi:hypothetical protein
MQAAIERLVAVAQPTKIILKPHVADRYEELIELDQSLAGIPMPVDILLVSETEFEERADQPGTVERAAQREGRVLYSAQKTDA